MPIIRIILPVALIITSQCNLFGELREQIIQKGKDLTTELVPALPVTCRTERGKREIYLR